MQRRSWRPRGECMRREVAAFATANALANPQDSRIFADKLVRLLLAGGGPPYDMARARAVYGSLLKAFRGHSWEDPLLARAKPHVILAAAACAGQL